MSVCFLACSPGGISACSYKHKSIPHATVPQQPATQPLDSKQSPDPSAKTFLANCRFSNPKSPIPMRSAPPTPPQPPDGLPAYRLLTGPDDAAFCRRVSEALALGYQLYGSPAATFNGEKVIVAQAVIWPSIQQALSQH